MASLLGITAVFQTFNSQTLLVFLRLLLPAALEPGDGEIPLPEGGSSEPEMEAPPYGLETEEAPGVLAILLSASMTKSKTLYSLYLRKITKS